jgi:hypothetical protein
MILTMFARLFWDRFGDAQNHLVARRAALCMYDLQVNGVPPLIVLESFVTHVLALYIAWCVDQK